VVLPWLWTDCSDGRIQYSRLDLLRSMLPVYRRLLKAGLRMLVYSGDVDAIVPVTGSRR
jgi:serine carboxypeptidase-like clade 2